MCFKDVSKRLFLVINKYKKTDFQRAFKFKHERLAARTFQSSPPALGPADAHATIVMHGQGVATLARSSSPDSQSPRARQFVRRLRCVFVCRDGPLGGRRVPAAPLRQRWPWP